MLLTIRTAATADRGRVRSLLQEAGLPTAGLDAEGVHLWVALHDGILAGSAAVEVHGKDGVLRSVCVAPEGRGAGVGVALVARCIAESRDLGLARLYLLTESAADWFPRFGFVATDRESVPPAVAGSIEFATLCPASAVAMALALEPAATASPEPMR